MNPRPVDLSHLERVAAIVPGRDWLAEVETLARDGESLLDTVERVLVVQALRDCKGLQRAAADSLRISSRSMNHYCQKYGLRPRDNR